MKQNILGVIIFSISLLFNSNNLYAQKIIEEGNISVQLNRVQQIDDSLYIDINIDKIGKNTKSRKSADLTPVLVWGSIEKDLPSISLKGRNNYREYRRLIALMNKKEKAEYLKNAPYTVIKDYKKESRSINYNLAIPFEQWMAYARVDLRKDDCGCGKTRTTGFKVIANNIELELAPELYKTTLWLCYLTPEVEEIKKREVSTEAFLDFKVNRTEINPVYMNNPLELVKIKNFTQELCDENSINIKSINIIGFASPEGSFAGNQRLSQGRAKALANYISQQFEYPRDMYKEGFGGENWTELKELV